MKSQAKQGEEYKMILEVEIPVEEMELALKLASKKISSKANIPGFRKGKAPQNIIESFVGLPAILEEAADELVPKCYADAVKEHGLEPVELPEIEITQLEKGKELTFTATFTVKPKVELGQYKELPLTRKKYQITDANIDMEINRLRSMVAKLVDLPEGETLKLGDVACFDFKGFLNGEAFEGGQANNYTLEVGSHTFIPGFEEQMLGLKQGEEKEINVTFPEQYQEEKLAGQPVMFQIKLNSIQRKELPELDDAFVQEISETCETLEQLREETREQLQKRFDENMDEACRTMAIEKAMENVTVNIPPLMIDKRLDEIYDDMSNRLQEQGMSLEDYLNYNGQSDEEFRAQIYPKAQKGVLMDLTLEAIADIEKLDVSPADLEAYVNNLAQNYGQPVEAILAAIEKSGQINEMIRSLKSAKAAEIIYNAAVITEELVEPPYHAPGEEGHDDALDEEAEVKAKPKKAAAKKEVKKEAKDETSDEVVKKEVKEKVKKETKKEVKKDTKVEASEEEVAKKEVKEKVKKETKKTTKEAPKKEAE